MLPKPNNQHRAQQQGSGNDSSPRDAEVSNSNFIADKLWSHIGNRLEEWMPTFNKSLDNKLTTLEDRLNAKIRESTSFMQQQLQEARKNIKQLEFTVDQLERDKYSCNAVLFGVPKYAGENLGTTTITQSIGDNIPCNSVLFALPQYAVENLETTTITQSIQDKISRDAVRFGLPEYAVENLETTTITQSIQDKISRDAVQFGLPEYAVENLETTTITQSIQDNISRDAVQFGLPEYAVENLETTTITQSIQDKISRDAVQFGLPEYAGEDLETTSILHSVEDLRNAVGVDDNNDLNINVQLVQTQQQQPLVNHIQHFNPNYEKEDDNENGEPTTKKNKSNKKSSTTTTKKPSTKKTNNSDNECNEKKPKRKYNKRNKTEDKAAAPPAAPTKTTSSNSKRQLLFAVRGRKFPTNKKKISDKQIKPRPTTTKKPSTKKNNNNDNEYNEKKPKRKYNKRNKTEDKAAAPTKTTSSNSKRQLLFAVRGRKLPTNNKKISDKLIKPRPIPKLRSPSSSSRSFDLRKPTPRPLHVPEQLQTTLIIPKKRQSVEDQTTIITPPQPPFSIQSPSSFLINGNDFELLSAETIEYLNSEPEIQQTTFYFFPDLRKCVFDEIMKTKTHEGSLSPERLHAARSDISDLNTFEKCEGCKLSTERYMVETNVIPDKVFSVNKSPIDYIKHKIIAPKLPREPTSELAENEFYEIYRKLDNGNFEKVPKSPDGKCMVYSYIHSNYTKNKFFAIFSQTNRVHYCNYEDFKYVRKSELHRSAPFIKLIGSTRRYRYDTYPTSVVLYSYMEDLFIELPNDDFFVNKFSTDPNEKYILRVKKSSSSSFNYIMSNRDTLNHALVYGTYQAEQVFTGKFGTGNKYSLDDLIEPTGHALLHSTVFHEDRSQIKVTTLIGMQYACYKYENLLQRKT